MIKQEAFIDSVDTVKRALPEPTDEKRPFKNWEIAKVMTKEFEMSYRKLKKVSITSNSVLNLVLR